MRLWIRLFVAFALLCGAVLVAFAVWQQHSFRAGFIGYLDAQDLARLQPAATRLARAYARHGSWDFLREHPQQFAPLVTSGEGGPPSAATPPPPRLAQGPGFGPPPGGPGIFPRLALMDAAGRLVVGNPHVSGSDPALTLSSHGRVVGRLRLAPMPQVRGAGAVALVQSQLRSALLAGVVILLGALILAVALARWLLAPVRALSDATGSLAAGNYDVHIGSARQDELGRLARDFDRLADTLRQHRQARRQWSADIAHELRTPLSILRGEIQALQDGLRPCDASSLQSLADECERLGHLIDDLYQLSLADLGALEYRFETLDVGSLVQGVITRQRRSMTDKGLVMDCELSEVSAIPGDARRLTQLIDNLLANACRYTDTLGRVRVILEDAGDAVHLAVEDTPPGVPDASLANLFDRLYRVDASRSRSLGGAGLGLAICKAIVDAHAGRIEAGHSRLGGLRLDVYLPSRRT